MHTQEGIAETLTSPLQTGGRKLLSVEGLRFTLLSAPVKGLKRLVKGGT